MKRLYPLLAICLLTVHSLLAVEPESTLIKIGDPAPAFSLTTTDGTGMSSEQLKGKVVLLNFFATWCGPCLEELPHLESEVWQKYKDRGLALVVVGREHSQDELVKFRDGKKLSMPFAPDPKREVYAKFATSYIPRNFVIGTDGKVAFQSVGFDKAEFAAMIKVIETELAKTK